MGDVFVISDLHAGDGSLRDTFNTRPGRKQELFAFVDYVKEQGGSIVVLGDLYECYQMNVGKVVSYNAPLVSKLREVPVTYTTGNHDCEVREVSTPLDSFSKHCDALDCNGVRLIHGHLQDPYCCSSLPNIDRITAIYAGMKKDQNGSAFYRGRTVESVAGARFGRLSRFWRRITFQPSYEVMQRRHVMDYAYDRLWSLGYGRLVPNYKAVLYGHTHEPGQFVRHGNPLPIFNCGSWVEDTCSFARISDGQVSIWDWEGTTCKPNRTLLPV